LFVEDELTLQKLIKLALEKVGHTVTLASTGAEALASLRRLPIELVLLDILLPDTSGFEVCRAVRQFSDVPLVMLTALNRPEDIVMGFDLGADDYITKPFRMDEVQVRIDAILRRLRWQESRTVSGSGLLQVHGVVLDDHTQEVTVRGQAVHLTPIEYRLLRYLMVRADRPISKEELFEQVWGYTLAGGTNLVEVAVRRLRNKVEENSSQPKLVVTVHSVGYKFVSEPASGPVME
jgi:DNA-binding response OmpR family regulator